MRPIRTPETNILYTLPGGNEDNFLHAQLCADGVKSNWELTPRERRMVAGGALITLALLGLQPHHPPVVLTIEPPFCRTCKTETRWDISQQRFLCPEGHET